ncbi:hypothetical protein [Pseudomonas silesiensis]|jgi:hypothetical protein|uniref:Uncharacterized protein n=1 Tax=Pseudomonas silesiensis TaxID=1853130 RepID=A0A191Z2L8_9PSED|nr:hypothetical protein [Pseudomonas silesiensis]ANJ59186.1 hypothetical protein PMA3_30040 [Pseudomonas silesiensis]VVP14746.1 hypothetical protein PS874_03388 [Pseudomonas fluorescens]
MKKTLIILVLISISHLYVGYYETRWAEDNKIVLFIKKEPTFQVKFENIFASDSDDRPLTDLIMEEIAIIRTYCKYRLGIETWLQTQEELEACKVR